MRISAILHKPASFCSRSGMHPLVEALGANPFYYESVYARVMRSSWTLGHLMRKAGQRYYGSAWNFLLPLWDEYRLSRQLDLEVNIVHFMWAEFASPRHPEWFGRGVRPLVGTFHASARRLPSVLRGFRCLGAYNAITLMSASQIPYFEAHGVARDQLHVILHGVDTRHFCPLEVRGANDDLFSCLMVGSTERDHATMRNILSRLPSNKFKITILTAEEQRAYYYGDVTDQAVFPGQIGDEELRMAYQQADLLVMPMLDCTANNAILESMACGTPVMVNQVGGISEYVDPSCNIVLDQHSVDEWVDRLLFWRENRDLLSGMRPRVRQWAETFDWSRMAAHYVAVYNSVLESGLNRQ